MSEELEIIEILDCKNFENDRAKISKNTEKLFQENFVIHRAESPILF